jgi:hypothetical protein
MFAIALLVIPAVFAVDCEYNGQMHKADTTWKSNGFIIKCSVADKDWKVDIVGCVWERNEMDLMLGEEKTVGNWTATCFKDGDVTRFEEQLSKNAKEGHIGKMISEGPQDMVCMYMGKPHKNADEWTEGNFMFGCVTRENGWKVEVRACMVPGKADMKVTLGETKEHDGFMVKCTKEGDMTKLTVTPMDKQMTTSGKVTSDGTNDSIKPKIELNIDENSVTEQLTATEKINPCMPNPCPMGKTCVANPACTTGRRGCTKFTCETMKTEEMGTRDPCTPNPCPMGKTCTMNPECTSTTSGCKPFMCMTNPTETTEKFNPCKTNPCPMGKTCTMNPECMTMTGDCQPFMCETTTTATTDNKPTTNPCMPNPCPTGRTCKVNPGCTTGVGCKRFTCAATDDMTTDPCIPNPCGEQMCMLNMAPCPVPNACKPFICAPPRDMIPVGPSPVSIEAIPNVPKMVNEGTQNVGSSLDVEPTTNTGSQTKTTTTDATSKGTDGKTMKTTEGTATMDTKDFMKCRHVGKTFDDGETWSTKNFKYVCKIGTNEWTVTITHCIWPRNNNELMVVGGKSSTAMWEATCSQMDNGMTRFEEQTKPGVTAEDCKGEC